MHTLQAHAYARCRPLTMRCSHRRDTRSIHRDEFPSPPPYACAYTMRARVCARTLCACACSVCAHSACAQTQCVRANTVRARKHSACACTLCCANCVRGTPRAAGAYTQGAQTQDLWAHMLAQALRVCAHKCAQTQDCAQTQYRPRSAAIHIRTRVTYPHCAYVRKGKNFKHPASPIGDDQAVFAHTAKAHARAYAS